MTVVKMTSKNIDVAAINSSIDSVKKVSLKDAIATMSTAKFYSAKNTDKRSLSVLSVVATIYNLTQTLETFDDDDVDAAFTRALLMNAKELFCIAQRMTNHLIAEQVDEKKVEKLRAEQAKLASKLAKYEAKQAKQQAKLSKKECVAEKIKAIKHDNTISEDERTRMLDSYR